jgi:hypothetical protein
MPDAKIVDAIRKDRRWQISDAKRRIEAAARETRVMPAALDNPRLTEALVINSVLSPAASAALVQAVARHAKWSRRKEIRAALLRTEHLSLARALEFSREIPAALLQEILASSRLPEKIKDQLLRARELAIPLQRWFHTLQSDLQRLTFPIPPNPR